MDDSERRPLFPIVFAAALGLLVAIGAINSPVAEAPSADKSAFEAWIKEGNEAWAHKRHAILKIDDAVYLKPGETAFLMSGDAYRWSLSAPRGLVPRVTYKDGKALMWHYGAKIDVDLLTLGEPLALDRDIDIKAQITQIAPGERGLRVVVYNQANLAAKTFKGIEVFAFNPGLIVKAAFEPKDKFVAEDFPTSRGWLKRFFHAGDAVLTIEGKTLRLPMYTDAEVPAEVTSLSAFFTDATTGTQSYGVGRYIDIEFEKGAFPPQSLTLDFNRAYNPNCARSAHYNCPIAKTNLAAAITAGEKKPSEGGH